MSDPVNADPPDAADPSPSTDRPSTPRPSADRRGRATPSTAPPPGGRTAADGTGAPAGPGRRVRRSRAEQQAATRAALVAAAEEVLAERGVAGTTVEEVTARAGFTRGAFYSNFHTKEDLVAAVLDARTAHEVADLTPLVAGAATPDELMSALRARGGDPEARAWRLLLAELRLHALRSPELRPRLAAWEQQQRAGYRSVVAHVLGLAGIEPPADLDLLALVIQVLDDGIATHHDIEGDGIAPQAFLDALDLLLRAAAALAAARPTTP